MFCKYCGEKIDNDSVFCKFCGGKVGYTEEETAAALEEKRRKEIEAKYNYLSSEQLAYLRKIERQEIGFYQVPEMLVTPSLAKRAIKINPQIKRFVPLSVLNEMLADGVIEDLNVNVESKYAPPRETDDNDIWGIDDGEYDNYAIPRGYIIEDEFNEDDCSAGYYESDGGDWLDYAEPGSYDYE